MFDIEFEPLNCLLLYRTLGLEQLKKEVEKLFCCCTIPIMTLELHLISTFHLFIRKNKNYTSLSAQGHLHIAELRFKMPDLKRYRAFFAVDAKYFFPANVLRKTLMAEKSKGGGIFMKIMASNLDTSSRRNMDRLQRCCSCQKKLRLKLPVRHQRPELWCPVGNGDGGGCHGARAGAGRGVHAPAGLENT